MKNKEASKWFTYAKENLATAKLTLESKLFNPCLQNIQQATEKYFKALLIENNILFQRTHSISNLRNLLIENGIEVNLSDDDCEFLDSIYLPSKYPLASALPDFEPNESICRKAIKFAEEIIL